MGFKIGMTVGLSGTGGRSPAVTPIDPSTLSPVFYFEPLGRSVIWQDRAGIATPGAVGQPLARIDATYGATRCAVDSDADRPTLLSNGIHTDDSSAQALVFGTPQTLTVGTGYTIVSVVVCDLSNNVNILRGTNPLHQLDNLGQVLFGDDDTNAFISTTRVLTTGVKLVIVTVSTSGVVTAYWTGNSGGEVIAGTAVDATLDTLAYDNNGTTNRIAFAAAYAFAFTANQRAGVSAYLEAQSWVVGL
jgi:hypothetical protein